MVSMGPTWMIPALLIRMLTRPNFSAARLTRYWHCSRSVTSVGTARTSRAPAWVISISAAYRFSVSRAARTSLAPCWAAYRATINPCPVDAPVTITTRSSSVIRRESRKTWRAPQATPTPANAPIRTRSRVVIVVSSPRASLRHRPTATIPRATSRDRQWAPARMTPRFASDRPMSTRCANEATPLPWRGRLPSLHTLSP